MRGRNHPSSIDFGSFVVPPRTDGPCCSPSGPWRKPPGRPSPTERTLQHTHGVGNGSLVFKDQPRPSMYGIVAFTPMFDRVNHWPSILAILTPDQNGRSL